MNRYVFRWQSVTQEVCGNGLLIKSKDEGLKCHTNERYGSECEKRAKKELRKREFSDGLMKKQQKPAMSVLKKKTWSEFSTFLCSSKRNTKGG